MISHFRRWIRPPHFANEDQNRSAHILYTILLICSGACLLFIGVYTVFNPDPAAAIGVTASLLVVALVALVLLQKGYLREAALLFIVALWLLITPSHFFFSGFRSSGVFAQVVVIVIAGLLVGRRAALLFAGLAIAVILALAYAEIRDLLPPPLSPITTIGVAANLIVTIVAVTALLYVALTGLYDALDRAHRNERELGQRNDELAAIQHSLEENLAELEQAQAQMQQYAAELEKSNRELQDFAYVVSHDLQAPLRKIQTFGDRLQMNYAVVLDERGRDYVHRMQSSAARMQTLIEDLLAFSRVATRTRPFTVINLNEVIEDVLADLETRIEEVDGRVTVDPLPIIEGDTTQMRQLFQNLIGNALKFHRAETPPLISVQSTPSSDGNVCIVITDNGIGFDPQYAGRIFQVFQRLHGVDEYEGTGIGLAVCKRIVERHNGRITASSTPGQGSTFSTLLPKHQN